NEAGSSDPVIVKYSAQNSGGSAVAPLHFVSRWTGTTINGASQKVIGSSSAYLALPGSGPSAMSSINFKKSFDGIAWVEHSLWLPGAGWGSAPNPLLAEGSGQWLMAYINNNYATNNLVLQKTLSSDFGSWQEIPEGPSFPGTFSGWGRTLNGLVYGEGKWVLFGWLANFGGDQALWVSEDDGATWVNRSPAGEGLPVSSVGLFALGGGTWVAIADQGRVWRSSDAGFTWSSTTFSGNPNFVGLVYGNNRFLLAAADGTVWTSTDGAVTWVQQLAPYPTIWWVGSNQLSSVTFGGGLFLLSDGRSSADGVRWTSAARWIPQGGYGGVIPMAGAGSVSLAHGPAGFMAVPGYSPAPPINMGAPQPFYQSVSPGVPNWISEPPSSEKAQWGVPFSRTLQAAGAISYQGSNLPDWLSLDPATGILSGVPVNPAPVGPAAPANGNILYTMVFYATNSSGISGARVYTLDVSRDITPPQITLLGENPMTIYKRSGPMMPPGSGFTDPGAQVTDDQEATRTIYGMNAVNENMVGTYTITYSTSDSYGNAATPVIRTVNVVLDPTGDEDGDGLTNGQETTLGTNPSQKDTDNDGVNDPVEVADGTNPSDVNSYRNFSQGLEAYFRFNGDSQDSSGHGRHATGVAVVLTNGLYGQTNGSYRFNGVDSYMTVAGIPIPTDNAFTWSLWINPESAKPYQAIVERAQALGNNAVSPWIFLNPDRKIQFMSYPPGDWGISSGSHAYQTNQWVHVAVTSTTNGIRRLYVDSVPVDEKTTSEYGHPLELLILGADRLMRPSYVEDIFYEGRMDEVRIYSRTLSAVEVGQLYQQGAPPDTVPPVITLIGADPLEIYRGSIFTDPGATVTDNVDATRTITGTGTVDTSAVGIYTLTYTAEDAAGNLAVPVTRTVNVVLDPNGDEDGDGLANGQEFTLGTDPFQRDSDNDGVNDPVELADGTSPTDSNSFQGLNRGLVYYYPFNGDTKDASGNGNHATAMGNSYVTNGIFRTIGDGGGYYSGGGYLPIPNINAYLSNACTVSLWVKDEELTYAHGEKYFAFGPETTSSLAMGIYRYPSEISFHLFQQGSPGQNAAEAIISTNNLSLPDFTQNKHLVLVFGGGSLSAYLNGSLIGNVATGLQPFPLQDNNLAALGMHWWGSSWSGSGNSARLTASYDNVRIYNRALSGEEVTQIYQLEVIPDTQAPVITLIGADPLEVYKGSIFTDPGATVTDNVDATRTI
ncbi:MAG: DUF5011 domain-containing protein, partial [Bacteroidetes bacterium]|nr:DUF5011 domain-containing protein [Bacteroidota bacterium]